MAITNAASTAVVHWLRSRSDAILVGINTVLNDDPLLTARPPTDAGSEVVRRAGSRSPRPLLRVVVDSQRRFPNNCQLAQTPESGRVIVFCSSKSIDTGRSLPPHVEIIPTPSLHHALTNLASRNVMHLLVEPGPTLARSFLQSNLADRVWLFRSNQIVNDETAPAAIAVPYPTTATIDLDGDELTESLNTASATFAANVMSADMTLLRDQMMESSAHGGRSTAGSPPTSS
jgi:diaminohydroxyphosphoribosylaminopyrimidine deaminase/5-amino-6-(5-phosphoribosylamino)uracil reductase